MEAYEIMSNVQKERDYTPFISSSAASIKATENNGALSGWIFTLHWYIGYVQAVVLDRFRSGLDMDHTKCLPRPALNSVECGCIILLVFCVG